MTWRWIDKRLLMLLHDESLADHGGATGLRNKGLLDSALARPKNLVAYGEAADLADRAAAYATGLAKSHPFVDGNKRAAFLSIGLFLGLNGHRLVAHQAEATVAMFSLAAGDWREAELAAWIREHAQRR
jgi:death-on-curing protein